MINKSALASQIEEQGILPLFYQKDIDINLNILKVLYEAGVRVVEYAHRGEAALVNFIEMKEFCNKEMKDMRLGIGTIKNKAEAKQYIDVGTDFIVSPGMVEKVGLVANESNILWIPGCMTPTEMIHAESLGATIVKLFPANNLGPSFLDAIQPVFPGLRFMPTGGIELNEEVITGWLKSGVCALGGSKLITKDIMENKLYDQLKNDMRNALQLYHSIRKNLLPH